MSTTRREERAGDSEFHGSETKVHWNEIVNYLKRERKAGEYGVRLTRASRCLQTMKEAIMAEAKETRREIRQDEKVYDKEIIYLETIKKGFSEM